jgi:hypothetical protein
MWYVCRQGKDQSNTSDESESDSSESVDTQWLRLARERREAMGAPHDKDVNKGNNVAPIVHDMDAEDHKPEKSVCFDFQER